MFISFQTLLRIGHHQGNKLVCRLVNQYTLYPMHAVKILFNFYQVQVNILMDNKILKLEFSIQSFKNFTKSATDTCNITANQFSVRKMLVILPFIPSKKKIKPKTFKFNKKPHTGYIIISQLFFSLQNVGHFKQVQLILNNMLFCK